MTFGGEGVVRGGGVGCCANLWDFIDGFVCVCCETGGAFSYEGCW